MWVWALWITAGCVKCNPVLRVLVSNVDASSEGVTVPAALELDVPFVFFLPVLLNPKCFCRS